MDFLQYLINGISIGAVYAIIALGYTMEQAVAELKRLKGGEHNA